MIKNQKNQDADTVPGVQKMSWLTESEWKMIGMVRRIVVSSGLWNRKYSRALQTFYTLVLWTILLINSYSVYVFKDNIDLLVQVVHHSALITTDLTWLIMMISRQNIQGLVDGSTTTYEYHSKLIHNFLRTRMGERLNLMKWIVPIVTLLSGSTVLFLHMLFILEITIFKTYKTLFPTAVPVGDLDNPFIYTYIFLNQETVIVFTVLMAAGTASLAFLSWNHLTLELETLSYAIAHIKDLVEEKLTGQMTMDQRIKEDLSLKLYDFYVYHFAKHHCEICRYFDLLQKTVDVLIFHFFLVGLISYACVGLTLTSDNMSVQLKFGMVFLLQNMTIYCWCWIAEDIIDKSDDISLVVESSPWWKMSKKSKSTLLLIMTRCKKPLALKSYFGTAVNNESYNDLLSSAYRIFSVILQMKYTSH